MPQALLTGSFALRQHIHKHLANRTTRYLTRTMVREALMDTYGIYLFCVRLLVKLHIVRKILTLACRPWHPKAVNITACNIST